MVKDQKLPDYKDVMAKIFGSLKEGGSHKERIAIQMDTGVSVSTLEKWKIGHVGSYDKVQKVYNHITENYK